MEEKSRNGTSSGDTRAELMDQIRQGKELKAVSTSSLEELDNELVASRNSWDQSGPGSQCNVITLQLINSNTGIDKGSDTVAQHFSCDSNSSFGSNFDSLSDFDTNSSTGEHIYVNISQVVTGQSEKVIAETEVREGLEVGDTVECVSYSWNPPKKASLLLKLLKGVVYLAMQLGVIWLFHWNLLFLFPYPTSVIVLIMSLGLLCALLLGLSLIPKTCYY